VIYFPPHLTNASVLPGKTRKQENRMFHSNALLLSLEVMARSVGAGTHSRSWRDRVPDFRSCNAEAAGTKWSASKQNREQIGIWQPQRMSRMMNMQGWVKAQRNGECGKLMQYSMGANWAVGVYELGWEELVTTCARRFCAFCTTA